MPRLHKYPAHNSTELFRCNFSYHGLQSGLNYWSPRCHQEEVCLAYRASSWSDDLSGKQSDYSGVDRSTMKTSCEDDDSDVIYKDVVIVGNGPSGICLSYMLAGNWPYYTGEPHPGDEMLTARLQFSTCPSDDGEARDIIEEEKTRNELVANTRREAQAARECPSGPSGPRKPSEGKRGLAHSSRPRLECLSSGIEGRSGGRPLALLMDQLQHPGVDMGLDIPSLLSWKSVEQHPEQKIIDHVVLGKGRPGGAWQSLDPNVLTISLSRWMSLPDLDLRHWEMLVEAEHLQQSKTNLADREPYSHQEKISACKTASRVPVGTVAAYYSDYVRRKGLEKYFRCGTVVTSVRPLPRSNERREKYGWIVDGIERKTGKRFRYRCERVILASGTTDLFNHLGVPGEDSQLDWVTHDLNDLESRLDQLTNQHCETVLDEVKPVLVVGAGLSAADAIMAARFHGIPVLHVFRDTSNEWSRQTSEKVNSSYDRLQWLPSSMYPEYHKVYEMMADGGRNYPLYKSLPGYRLADLSANSSSTEKTVTLCAPNGQLDTFQVSIVAILIGYKADLSYLESSGIGLGRYPEKPIDSKSNPIQVDDITYEVVSAPRPGLYALGPLVGDNFVRFILGGAFGILAHILSTPTT